MQYQNNEFIKFDIGSDELTKICSFEGLEYFLLGEDMFCITILPATPLLI